VSIANSVCSVIPRFCYSSVRSCLTAIPRCALILSIYACVSLSLLRRW